MLFDVGGDVGGLQQRRHSDSGYHLSDEGDRLLSHGMRVSNVGLDHVLEGERLCLNSAHCQIRSA